MTTFFLEKKNSLLLSEISKSDSNNVLQFILLRRMIFMILNDQNLDRNRHEIMIDDFI